MASCLVGQYDSDGSAENDNQEDELQTKQAKQTNGTQERRETAPTTGDNCISKEGVLIKDCAPVIESVPVTESTPILEDPPVKENPPVKESRAIKASAPVTQSTPIQKSTPLKAFVSANCNSRPNNHRQYSKKRARNRRNSGLPADLQRELDRSGLQMDDITFQDVDGRQESLRTVSSDASKSATSSKAYARIKKIVEKTGVTKHEKRKHQITALAADALARTKESQERNEN